MPGGTLASGLQVSNVIAHASARLSAETDMHAVSLQCVHHHCKTLLSLKSYNDRYLC